MEIKPVSRRAAFRWSSRVELYEYFKRKYGIDRRDVDNEIQRVMSSFRPRKNESIKTQELWEKVGINLEKKLSGSQINLSTSQKASDSPEAEELDPAQAGLPSQPIIESSGEDEEVYIEELGKKEEKT